MSSIPIPSFAPTSPATETMWQMRLASLRNACRHDLLGIEGLSLARLAWTFVFVALFALSSTLGNVLGGKRPGFCQDGAADCFLSWLPTYAVSLVPQMLALTLADNLPLRGAMRFAALGAATVLAAFALPVLACTVVPLPGTVSDCRDFPSLATLDEFSGNMIYHWYIACVIAAAYFTRRRDRELAAALHTSQLARIDAHRNALEADLQVMQARVEPAFLFGALRDVAVLYESDHRAGDRLLDHLIQYLRAALPDMRATGSTVGKEAALLRAYLNILASRSDGRLAAAIHVARDIDDARMPPMMLVPLVAPPADAGTPVHRHDGSIRVDIRRVDGRLRIALAATGGIAHSIADSPAVGDVRARLDALYGARASLAVDASPADRSQLILEIPQ